MGSMQTQPQQQKLTPQQQNSIARSMVLKQAVDRVQQIFSSTFNPASSATLNIPPRNVGLIKGFWVNISGTITNGGEDSPTPTDFNLLNLIQQISFTDLQNNIRIQTAGWHLGMINSLKAKRPWGSAFLNSAQDDPIEYGSHFTVNAITNPGAPGPCSVSLWVYVPLAYSDMDLRGSIYGNVLQATMQLSIVLNTGNLSVATGSDDTLAVYVGTPASNMVLNPVTVTVYQHYLDQLPLAQNGQAILPMLDLSTIYELKNTVLSSIVPNQDFPIPYSNFRDFISTMMVFFNGTNRLAGSDINYLALQSANFTNLWKYPPVLQAIKTRNHLGYDLPPGAYYFGSRNKPISTVQYGNMELLLNATSAAVTGAYVLMGYEDFALMNTLSGAGSLASS